jgi:hypothetical protein
MSSHYSTACPGMTLGRSRRPLSPVCTLSMSSSADMRRLEAVPVCVLRWTRWRMQRLLGHRRHHANHQHVLLLYLQQQDLSAFHL